MDFDEAWAVEVSEAGGCRVTAFCPICRQQVFGYASAVVVDDLVEHMNEFHVSDAGSTVGRSGHA